MVDKKMTIESDKTNILLELTETKVMTIIFRRHL